MPELEAPHPIGPNSIDPDPRKHYGPTAIVTIPNVITFGRAASLPLMFYLMTEGRNSPGTAWAAFVLWVVLGISDTLDGIVARRLGTTTSGAYLDPLADKLQVIGALTILWLGDRISWVPLSLIVAREFLVSGLRSVAARRGISIPATPFGKAKTLAQMSAVGLFLFPPFSANDGPATIAIWVAVGFTLASGLDYAWRGIHILSRPVADVPAPDSGSLEESLEPVISALLDKQGWISNKGDARREERIPHSSTGTPEEDNTIVRLRNAKETRSKHSSAPP